MPRLRKLVAIAVVCLLVYLPAGAQEAVPNRNRLRIIALDGNNAVNYIPIPTVTAPVVEIRDENDRPVEGAVVIFKLPASGPGGTFADKQLTQTVITNNRGQAEAKNFQINSLPGRFVIEINASYQDKTGRLLMPQTNSVSARDLDQSAGARSRSGRLKWLLIGGGIAGAALGIYFGTRSSNTPISVSAGPATVGGPR